MEDLANLDKKLRRLRNRPTEMYGGLSIIFAGDFHQIRCNRGTPLYMKHTTHWQGSINCTVMLEGTHRFKDDPEWGEILGRIRSGSVTQADIKEINERFLGLEGVELPPSSEDVCYAVFKNDERNSISAGLFNDLIKSTVSNHSVTFHRLRHPVWMTRHHALIYGACNASTPLGNLTGVGAGY